MEIAALLADGKNAAQIATILSISRGTVMTHIRIACWKLQVESRIGLIVLYAQWQLLKELNNAANQYTDSSIYQK